MAPSSDDLREVLAAARREGDVIAAGDADGYLDLLDEEAVFLPPGVPAKTGLELRSWLTDFVRNVAVEWLEYIDGATVLSGDLAVHDYAYLWRVTPRSTAEPIVSRGKGIQVFRRDREGRWKLLRNVWNANPA